MSPLSVVSSDGTKIAYEKLGRGPAVILVGGALIHRNFAPFKKLAELLATEFTVIHYDRRGRFDSGDTLPYSPEKEIEDLAALVECAGGSASVYGISSGAALVIEAAAKGLAFDKIALYEPPYVQWNEKKFGDRETFISEAEDLLRKDRRSAVLKRFMKLVGVPAVIRLVMPLFSFWKEALLIAHTVPYDLRILGDRNVPHVKLARIHSPVLVMAGELSSLELKDAAKAVAANCPVAEFKELKGQRHDVSPQAQAAALEAFFHGFA